MKLQIHNSLTEQQLIEGCKKGSRKAQQQVYDAYARYMYGVCIRYIGNRQEAEDVMIEGFMKVFTKVDQYGERGSFKGWIRRIMVNEALGYLRKNKSMYVEVDVARAELEPDYGMLSGILEAEDLMKLVQELPVGYRTVFNLYAIEGYSHKEIAERLGIHVNTSKSQLSRARALLQQWLCKIDHGQISKTNGYGEE
jgi:RNA polymerase sigma-70 factor (ECF subfamily)